MGKFLCKFKTSTMTILHQSNLMKACGMASGLCLGVIRVAFVFSRLEKSATQAQTGNLETATNRRLLFTDALWKNSPIIRE